MQTCVVTGGSGFIGSHITRALAERGCEVVVIDNLSASTLDPIKDLIESGAVRFYQVDIRDREKLDEIFTGEESVIFHMAADPRVKESVDMPVESFDQNVAGTINLLEIMRLKNVPCLVFASSGGTLYGDVETFPTPETEVLRPISPYGASKAAAEMYLSAYANAYEMKIAALRLANIYGPGSGHGVMFDFFQKLKQDPNRLEILGDGTQSKSYLFVADCVKAFLAVADWIQEQKAGTYEYFNIGTESWESVSSLAETMISILGLEGVEFAYTGGFRGWVGDVAKMLLDINKIRFLWQPETPFYDGVKAYLDSLQS
jgi:UDP-glucose 4-epimerase